MASSYEFVQFACEQIAVCGNVSHKKMFGEYMVYLNGKPIFLICNDTLFIKINDEVASILGQDAEQGCPYNGAKVHYIVTDIDDKEKMENLALVLERITPLPKPKKKKQSTD